MDLSAAGVFADKDFRPEELVLREAVLVGAQHSRNKVRAMFFFSGVIKQIVQGCISLEFELHTLDFGVNYFLQRILLS